ncbi:hypothetical protein NE237_032717 [Protea cynaroides]|uniref:Uncharacterized protein n=1 Tax=Protea cynaroides TaxID=273540 RepID=A0A9Q0R3D4_9MAGN|nr:hypothetical protein NE237_032717 [Protea cynaroides]
MGFAVRSAVIPLLTYFRHKQSSPTKLLWIPSDEAAKLLQGPNFFRSLNNVKTRAFTPSSPVLGVSSPPASFDVSVLLQSSVILFTAFWIANFVVPDIVSKNLQPDNPCKKEQTPDDKISSQDESGNKVETSEANSRTSPKKTKKSKFKKGSRSFKEVKTSKF